MGLKVRNGKIDFQAPKDAIQMVGPLLSTTALKEKIIEQDLASSLTLTAAIPAGAVVVGYTCDVLEKIVCSGDRTAVSIGHASTNNHYGSKNMTSQTLAAGTRFTWADAGTDPTFIYRAAQNLVFAGTGATTGNITAGKVRVILRYWISS